MSDEFDPYHMWLGIPADEQPADYYRLLGLRRFESNIEVIEAAADRQMSHVQRYKIGRHSALSQRILNELAAARLGLLKPEKRAAYDQALREAQARQQAAAAPPASQSAPTQQSNAPHPTAQPDAARPVRAQPTLPQARPAAKLPASAPARVAQNLSRQQAMSVEPTAETERRPRRAAQPTWNKSHLITIGVVGITVIFLGSVVLLRTGAPAKTPAPISKGPIARADDEKIATPPAVKPNDKRPPVAATKDAEPQQPPIKAVEPAPVEAKNDIAPSPTQPAAVGAVKLPDGGVQFQVPTEIGTAYVSNDGKLVIVQSKGIGRLFEVGTARELGEPRTNSVRAGFLPDGVTPFVAPWEGPLTLLDTKSGARAGAGVVGYQTKSIAFSPDGRRAAIGQMRGVVAISELTGGAQKSYQVFGRKDEVEGIAFSGDGRKIIAVTKNKVKVIDASSGSEAGVIDGLLSFQVAALPDGRIVSGAHSGAADVEVRDPTSGKIIATWRGHTGLITRIAVNQRGDCVTVSSDHTARSWEIASGKSKPLWQHSAELKAAAFSADGNLLLLGGKDGQIRIMTLASGKPASARVLPTLSPAPPQPKPITPTVSSGLVIDPAELAGVAAFSAALPNCKVSRVK